MKKNVQPPGDRERMKARARLGTGEVRGDA